MNQNMYQFIGHRMKMQKNLILISYSIGGFIIMNSDSCECSIIENSRIITVEEHFATPEFFKGPGSQMKVQAELNPQFKGLIAKLLDLDKGRISDMDKSDIGMQILSLNWVSSSMIFIDTSNNYTTNNLVVTTPVKASRFIVDKVWTRKLSSK